jgi:hypothetical protein
MVAARIDLTWGGLDFHRATLAALNVSSRGALAVLQRQCSDAALQGTSVVYSSVKAAFLAQLAVDARGLRLSDSSTVVVLHCSAAALVASFLHSSRNIFTRRAVDAVQSQHAQ